MVCPPAQKQRVSGVPNPPAVLAGRFNVLDRQPPDFRRFRPTWQHGVHNDLAHPKSTGRSHQRKPRSIRWVRDSLIVEVADPPRPAVGHHVVDSAGSLSVLFQRKVEPASADQFRLRRGIQDRPVGQGPQGSGALETVGPCNLDRWMGGGRTTTASSVCPNTSWSSCPSCVSSKGPVWSHIC